MSYNEPPPPYDLPEGWVKQHDSSSGHDFWVDTRAQPPRSIWSHPYEDELFLSEHPEIRERFGSRNAQPAGADRRHSFGGNTSVRPPTKRNSISQPGSPVLGRAAAGEKSGQQHKRGFFGKMKDKAIGTKEERAEHARLQHEYEMQRERQRQQEIGRLRQQYAQQQRMYGNQYGSNGMYGPPPGNPLYGRRGMGGGGMGYGGGGGGMGFGGGGMAMPLLGGLAGGLLLGDMLDGGFGGGMGGGGGFF